MAHISDNITIENNLTHSGYSPVLTTTATSTSGTLTLSGTSTFLQETTGSAIGYSIILPNATTLSIGTKFEIWNQSTQPITLKYFGGATAQPIPATSFITATLETNTSAAGSWLFFRAFTGTASGILNYNVVSSTPFDTQSRTPTYTTISGFQVTPVAGTYVIFYSASVYYTTTSKAHYWAIFKGGTIVQDSARSQDTAHSNQTLMDSTQTVTQVTGSQVIDIQVCCANTGQLTVNDRSLILIRVGD